MGNSKKRRGTKLNQFEIGEIVRLRKDYDSVLVKGTEGIVVFSNIIEGFRERSKLICLLMAYDIDFDGVVIRELPCEYLETL